MRFAVVAGAAFALLVSGALVSWEDSDGKDVAANPSVVVEEEASRFYTGLRCSHVEEVDADVTRLLRMWPVDRRDIRVAGLSGVVEEEPNTWPDNPRVDATESREVVDENPYLEEATAYYGVEWAREALVTVRFRESSNIIEPCQVGDRLERGPYQFKPSTWAATPYAHLDSCDLHAATWATAWKVSQPGGKEAWAATWPR